MTTVQRIFFVIFWMFVIIASAVVFLFGYTAIMSAAADWLGMWVWFVPVAIIFSVFAAFLWVYSEGR